MDSDTDSFIDYAFEDLEDEEIVERHDYIIVVDRNIKSTRYFPYLVRFIDTLQERGVKVELGFGQLKENVYVKLHLSREATKELARAYDIDIQNTGHHYISVSAINLKISQTPLTLNQDIFTRKGEATNMERIMIVCQLLNEARFGGSRFDNLYGIKKLIRMGAVKDAYPLHDGDCHYDKKSNEPLNDRQMLLKYWASFSMWYKEQPLNLIEKYYGTEVAFYFAWLGLYNTMLIPASVVGLVCFLLSVLHLFAVTHESLESICKSKLMMCPPCSSGHSCVFYPLKIDCYYTHLSILFDNYFTVFFAVFMSFWATVFLNLWTRIEKLLKIRWNVEYVQPVSETRQIFRERSAYSRMSLITGKYEPYTPWKLQLFYYFLSYGTCALLVGIVLLALFGVIMYRIAISALLRMTDSKYLQIHATFIESVASAVLQVVFIKLYGKFYAPLSEWLARLERPRTQQEFDSSVVHKRYFLGFANNYVGLFYIAFLKGRFYLPFNTSVSSVRSDYCHPCGCLMAVCVQLFVIMLLKSLAGNILTLIIPFITQFCKKKEVDEKTPRPQWEVEFQLYPAGRFLLTTEFMDMIIQYGFVTFFVAAFPLAPLCALINNCLQLRLDAYELVTRYRRPLPRRQSGIGIWNNILVSVTHLSVATNAFVLAFTSDFVSREIYKYKHGNTLKGYIESTLSVVDLKDVLQYGDSDMLVYENKSTLCYYRASRYPPDHPQKYELTSQYWFEVGMRLLCVILFEHFIMFTCGLVAHFLPDAPQKLKEAIHREKTAECNKALAAIDDNARTARNRWRRSARLVIQRKKTQ
ncbi:unnamed protein product [Tenebrio molitor]|nr:unnamed protein product [Tenebrio molitor]